MNGRVDVDERLNARVSQLQCQGEGMIGGVVAGVIAAKLKQFEGRQFPLAGAYLSNVKLQGIQVDASDPVRVSATFET